MSRTQNWPLDFADLKGQMMAKRAMEIAAAGGHHLALIGPTGCGKTSLAHAFAALLPGPTADQSKEICARYREAGQPLPAAVSQKRPVIVPSAFSGLTALAGSAGTNQVGALALAHHGFLILDDAHRFQKKALEVIREVLDCGKVKPSRGLPRSSRFQMLVTARSCRGHMHDRSDCCDDPMGCGWRALTPALRRFLDVVDIQVELEHPTAADWSFRGDEEPGFRVLRRVAAARPRQVPRGAQNCDLKGRDLYEACQMDYAASHLLDRAILAQGHSARDVAATLRVARSIADLEAKERVERVHLAEALIYRFLPMRLNQYREPACEIAHPAISIMPAG